MKVQNDLGEPDINFQKDNYPLMKNDNHWRNPSAISNKSVSENEFETN